MKKTELENLILRLLEGSSSLSVHDVAMSAGFSKSDEAQRKAVQRAFTALVKRGVLEPRGEARARVYTNRVTEEAGESTDTSLNDAFDGIPLSGYSKKLLEYLGRPQKLRKPVGYDPKFLRSYVPNRSFYLSAALREEFRKIGKVEEAVRPAGTYARNILDRLLIDLSWNSSRLEGNTYSMLETKRLIELGESAPGKDAAEAQMILNHKAAIEYIVDSSDEARIGSQTVCNVHALLSDNLLGDPGASGRLRRIAVKISGTVYEPIDNPHLLKECFELFVEKLNLISDPFERAVFSLAHIAYLQAFEDVNKRTARLVANIPLIRGNLKPLSFQDVEKESYAKAMLGVYEKNDVSLCVDLFAWAYRRSCLRYSAIQQSLGEPNLMKIKFRTQIQDIVRTLVAGKIPGSHWVSEINQQVERLGLPGEEAKRLFVIIEEEVLNLHEGNFVRFKIRPSEFKEWNALNMAEARTKTEPQKTKSRAKPKKK